MRLGDFEEGQSEEGGVVGVETGELTAITPLMMADGGLVAIRIVLNEGDEGAMSGMELDGGSDGPPTDGGSI